MTQYIPDQLREMNVISCEMNEKMYIHRGNNQAQKNVASRVLRDNSIFFFSAFFLSFNTYIAIKCFKIFKMTKQNA